jgi:ATP-dependent Clp protease adaptor protein ClpS
MPEAPSIIETPQTTTRAQAQVEEPWHVVVMNDPVNLMPYVTRVIMQLFGYPKEKAQKMMMAVHQLGKCTVWTGEREKAEHYVHQLHRHQLQAIMTREGSGS